MPSRKTIRILAISKGKKGIYSVKTSTKTFLINEESLADLLLYVGKELTPLQYSALSKASSLSSLYQYAHSLFGRRTYSSGEVRKKLQSKFKNSKEIPEIIYNLKKEHLLDDKQFAIDYAEMRCNELYGKKKIIDELTFDKGIDGDIIASLSFDEEEANAASFLKQAKRKYASLPLLTKKRKLEESLIRRGFDKDIAKEAVSTLKDERDGNYERKLSSDAKVALTRYGRKYNGYELRSKVFAYLSAKGYKAEEIEKVLKENK